MGWIKDVSPCLVDFRLEFRKDQKRGAVNDGAGESSKPDRLLTLQADPMTPAVMARLGIPFESQTWLLTTDDPGEISDVTMGDRFVRLDTGDVLTATDRPTVSPATDYPAAEVFVRDQTQLGRRT